MPAFKALLAVVAGLIIGIKLSIGLMAVVIASAAVLLASAVLLYRKQYQSIVYFPLCIAIGMAISYNLSTTSVQHPRKLLPTMKACVEGVVTKVNKVDTNSITLVLNGYIDTPELPKVPNQNVYVKAFGNFSDLYAGTYVRFSGSIRLPNPKILPNEFDEENYFAGNNIQWIATTDRLSWNTTNKNLYYWRDISVRKIKSIASKLFSYDQNYLVQALLLGDKSEIPPEIKQIYSLSGTAHVLALSGLHIGLISFILFMLFSFVRNRVVKFSLFSLFLIAFVFLSGLQPSALRAASMAILVVYAKLFERQFNLLNILSVVVLLSIAFDPSLILSVGFQMSVAAILGIAFLYTPAKSLLNSIIPANSTILSYIKNSLAMTISASSIVSPLVAYYFGIFSIVSYLSNLLIIPLISLSLIFAIVSIIASQIFMPLAMLYGDLTTFLLLISERINQFSVNLPLAYIAGSGAMLASVLSLVFAIYLIFSDSLKLLFFRFAACFVATAFIAIFYQNQSTQGLQIYPREQAVVSVIPLQNAQTFVYIADRKPSQYARNDYPLNNFLSTLKDSVILAVNGNCGINTADFLREKRTFRYIELSPDLQNKINLAILKGKVVSQVIEY